MPEKLEEKSKNIVEYLIKVNNVHDITELPRKEMPDLDRWKIMLYLRNTDFITIGALLNPCVDAFTGEPMHGTSKTYFDDGNWCWMDSLWIYFRDYDIVLPEEFITRVEKFYDDGGHPNVPSKWEYKLFDHGSEYERHHKGRNANPLWKEEFEIRVKKTICHGEVLVLPMEFHQDSQQLFFPVMAYIEDDYYGKSDIYLKARYRMLMDGTLILESASYDYTRKIEKIVNKRIEAAHLDDLFQSFIEKDIRSAIPISRVPSDAKVRVKPRKRKPGETFICTLNDL